MIARSFKSVLWVATVGGAVLGCYMVSLKVATERSDLAKVERQIVSTQRDIRALQTELGTRGRLAQLEDWNANVLALSAPAANQFLPDHLTLARLEQQAPTVEQRSAEVHMAALQTGTAEISAPSRAPVKAEAPVAAPKLIRAVQTASAAPARPSLIHQASFTTASAPLRPAAAAAPPLRTASASSAPVRTASASPTPARTTRSSRIDSIASEIGAASRPERAEKTGRERGAGTR